MTTALTLLGIAPTASAAAQRDAMATIAGPRLTLIACGDITAIAQTATRAPVALSAMAQPASGTAAPAAEAANVPAAEAANVPAAEAATFPAAEAVNPPVSQPSSVPATPAPGTRAAHAASHAALLRSPAARAHLLCLQRRLEMACQHGPFLPADPAAAAATLPALRAALEREADPLAAALQDQGSLVQWDVVMTWPAEAVLARHRAALLDRARQKAAEPPPLTAAPAAGTMDPGAGNRLAESLATPIPGAPIQTAPQPNPGAAAIAAAIATTLAEIRAARVAALAAALTPVCRALQPLPAGECAAAFTVLLPKGDEDAIAAALEALPEEVTHGADANLKGPLPPLAFASIRLASSSAETVSQAWSRFGLPQTGDAAGLRAAWRRLLPGLHPDHGAPNGEALQQASTAYRLLRAVLPRSGAATLRQAQDRAALRLLPTPPETAP